MEKMWGKMEKASGKKEWKKENESLKSQRSINNK